MHAPDLQQSENAARQPDAVPFAEAVKWWLKLGCISFGGPAGQISMMHQELVERRRWISEKRFLHALNYTMVLPGPEAQQLATYIGWLMHGTIGGIVAGGLFILPSLIVLLILSFLYLEFGDLKLVASILYGIKPVVVAIVAHAAWRIGNRALRNPSLWLLAIVSFAAIFVFNVPFPFIVLGAGLVGIAGARLAPQQFLLGTPHESTTERFGNALIDDNTPVPAHARFSRQRLIWQAGASLLLFTSAWMVLVSLYGSDGVLPTMAWFFTKAALVTFGGAYAVLPYVYQGGVEQFGWLTGPQMIDGLALGESTPGPLIMIVAFVGFVAGWTQEIFGPNRLPIAGIAGAVTATFFTFLPSFLLILAGGPLVEATRNKLPFTAPLAAITAAVVGVILNLAVFFAIHVFWPGGLSGAFDLFSAGLFLLVTGLLFFSKLGMLPVLFLGMVAGLIHTFAPSILA